MDYTSSTYYIVSFDRRGVENSGITLTCPLDETSYWSSLMILSQSSELDEQYVDTTSLLQRCTEENEDTAATYAGTSAVVQDMMHFTTLQAALHGYDKPRKRQSIIRESVVALSSATRLLACIRIVLVV
jgi:hypothetical protein